MQTGYAAAPGAAVPARVGTSPPVAVAAAPARAMLAATPGLVPGWQAGTAAGGGGVKVLGINIGRMAVFAALGAAAAAFIPPLAFLGGPVGGAIAGAVLSLIL